MCTEDAQKPLEIHVKYPLWQSDRYQPPDFEGVYYSVITAKCHEAAIKNVFVDEHQKWVKVVRLLSSQWGLWNSAGARFDMLYILMTPNVVVFQMGDS